MTIEQNAAGILINKQTVSGVTAVNFINLRGYSSYSLIMNNMQRATAGATVNTILQVSINNGVSYITTGYLGASEHSDITQNTWTGTTSVSNGMSLVPTALGAGTTGFAVQGNLLNMNATTGYIFCSATCIYYDGVNAYRYYNSSYYTTVNTNANTFRIVGDVGGTFSGTITLYGSV